MFFEHFGNKESNIIFIWMHGWGVDHTTLQPLANLFPNFEHYMIDFAGFGKSEPPQEIRGVKEYANDLKNFLDPPDKGEGLRSRQGVYSNEKVLSNEKTLRQLCNLPPYQEGLDPVIPLTRGTVCEADRGFNVNEKGIDSNIENKTNNEPSAFSLPSYQEGKVCEPEICQNNKTIVLLGHSFGGRVAIKYASLYPQDINGIVLIAGAGLPYKHSKIFKLYLKTISILSPIIKKIFPFLKNQTIFGSADYKKTNNIMREIIKKVVNEDLSNDAKKIILPSLLLYGKNDRATPPYFGEQYNEYIKNSKLILVPDANHYSLLFEKNKQTQYFINNFIKENFK